MATPNAIMVQDGKSIDYRPAAAVDAGDIVDLGDLLGVAKVPIGASALGALALEGVYDLVKDGTTGPVFAIGDAVYWHKANELAVRTGGSGCVFFGTCVRAAGTDEDRVRATLTPMNLPADMQDKLWEDISLASSSKTLDIEDSGKVMNITAGSDSNVVTLPAIAAGYNFVVRVGTGGQRVAVSPQAADRICGPDHTGTDNKDQICAKTTSRAGDYIALKYLSADGYIYTARRGVWAQE